MTLSCTLSWVKTRWPSTTCTSPAFTASRGPALLMSWPPKVMVPVRGSRPEMAFSSVLLPAPLGPSRATISPAPTVRSMPFSTPILP